MNEEIKFDSFPISHEVIISFSEDPKKNVQFLNWMFNGGFMTVSMTDAQIEEGSKYANIVKVSNN